MTNMDGNAYNAKVLGTVKDDSGGSGGGWRIERHGGAVDKLRKL